MPYLYRTTDKNGKPHPRWRFQYRDWQGRKRKETGTTSRAETERIAAKIEAKHAAIRNGHLPRPKPKDRPFDEASTAYFAWGETQGGRHGRPWAPEHTRKRRSQLSWWKERLELRYVSDLDGSLTSVEDALHDLMEGGSAGKTLSNYAETIAAFCVWCVERQLLSENPLANLAPIDATPKEGRRALTREEIQRLLAVAPPARRLLLEVAFCTGLRANELRQLQVQHLDVERSGLRLDAAWTKNRKEGFQPLSRKLVERLRAESADKGPDDPLLYVPSHPARELDVDLARAGIEKRTTAGKIDFHACRVAYTTLVVNAGANVKEAQSLLRHSDPRITMKTYARTQDVRLARVAESVGRMVLGGDGETDDITDDEGQGDPDPGQVGAPILPPQPFSPPNTKVPTESAAGTSVDHELVEAGGIEPPSRDYSAQASTGIVLRLSLVSPAPKDRIRRDQPR